MDIKLFEKYLTICRKHGVEQLRIGEIEVKLSPEAPKSRYKEAKESKEAFVSDQTYSEMDMLMWSAGGIPAQNEGPDA